MHPRAVAHPQQKRDTRAYRGCSMRSFMRFFLLPVAVLYGQSALAIQCSSPTLKGASGVIGNQHSYKIAGDCSYTWSETETGVFTSSTTSHDLSFSYVGSARWDRLTGQATEKLAISGDSTGQRVATASCSQDPFLKDPPGGSAKCGPVTVQAEVKSGGIYKLLTKPEFWALKKLSLAEAQALSALPPPGPPAGSGTQTPPAAAAQKPLQKPQPQAQPSSSVIAAAAAASLMDIEGEAFVKTGRFLLAGGQARVQPMAGFGNSWSGDEQLFWSDGAVGAVLDLTIDVPAASKYAVEIYLTRAPDYGQLSFEIDGRKSATTFDGMAPAVMRSGPVQLGTFALQPGPRQLSLMIIGRHAQSTGYYAGIDKLRLYPAGPIN